ncbi:hypothetical protein E4U54_006506 [Claviceps lovelessii]|nr:hypothetical protein E4U54_006506 [Claviceps lovelessii]
MVPTPRASAGLLRNRIKAPPSRAVRASPRYMSATQVSRVKDDLGGPGGQQPPPRKPFNPDMLRQQWFRIGGGVFLLLAAYAYFSPRETKDAAKRSALDLERTAERKVGISPLKEDAFEASRNMAAQTSDQAGKTMRELSGREKTKQGSFRHE